MTQEELQALISRAKLGEFRHEAIPAGSDAVSQARPVRALLKNGKVVEGWYDCAGGFDPRYDWTLKVDADSRLVVRPDINAISKIGIDSTTRRIAGQESSFDPVAAKDDIGYPNAAELIDEETGEEVIAVGNPTEFNIIPFLKGKQNADGLTGTKSQPGWVKKTKKEWMVDIGRDIVPDDEVEWMDDDSLPLGDPNPPKTPEEYLPCGARVRYVGSAVYITSDYNERPEGSYPDYDKYLEADNPQDWVQRQINGWLASHTFTGTYTLCKYTPKADWYGSVVPLMAMSPSGYLMDLPTTTWQVGSINVTRYAWINIKYSAGSSVGGKFPTAFKNVYVPWSGRLFVTTNEEDNTGINLMSGGFDAYPSLYNENRQKYNMIYVPPMFFRKGVTYYFKVALERGIVCDYRLASSTLAYINKAQTKVWPPLMPIDNYASIYNEDFKNLYTGKKRLYRTAYGRGIGANLTEGSFPNYKRYDV